jgi:hypothetical protein
LACSKNGNVNKGNTSKARGRKCDTVTTERRLAELDSFCSTGDDPKPFWIKHSGVDDDDDEPSNKYGMSVLKSYTIAGLREAIAKKRFHKCDDNGRQYRIYSLNEKIGINRFRSLFPNSPDAIPKELTYKEYKTDKNGYDLAMLLPDGVWTVHNAESFNSTSEPNKRSQSAAGSTSVMKKMKMTTTSSSL